VKNLWISTAVVSLAAHGAFAAWIATKEPAKKPVRPAIEMRLAPPPPKKVEPPPPPPPEPPKPQLVKKLAPKPIVHAAPPQAAPPEVQKVGIDPDMDKGGPALAAGGTSEGTPGTGNTMDKTPAAPPPPPEPPAPAARPGKHFVPIFSVTRMPKAKRAVAPEIPAAFRDAQREALVVVEVELDEQGRVTGARVVRHAEFGLDDAALAAAKQTEFEPALVGTQAVAVRYQIPYRFRVRG
jgi:protein TonB